MLLRSAIKEFRFWRCKKALRAAIPLFLSTLAVFFSATTILRAQSVQHLSTTQPGGMPGLPVMGGIQRLTNGVQITWDGPAGYYQVYQKSNSLGATWAPLGQATNLVRYAVITRIFSNAFFSVSGPPPRYAGARVCNTCHASICRYETNTPHASAFIRTNFVAQGGQTNGSCLACHTVGYSLPTGFSFTNKNGIFSYATNLAGVQCENCHGPAANHAAAPDNPTMVPRVEIAATVCGGCHTGPMQPTYEEWNSSGHATVTPHTLSAMASSTNNINNCGACHSGSARLALIRGVNPAATLTKDYDVPITCAVCHDPHATNSHPAQLRNPLSSTNNFELTANDTAGVNAFTNKYYSSASTNLNLCAQCHNDRGTAWTDTSRAPHNSLQYNYLLGSVGELQSGSAAFNPGPHSGLPSSANGSISGAFYLTNQCSACHLQPDAAPAITHSHTFVPTYDVCSNCHDGQAAQAFFTAYLSNSVAGVISGLNRWASTKAPASLRTNGVVAWEYTTPGGLTWTNDAFGNVKSWTLSVPPNFTGPDADGQALLRTNYPNILKARFDLYLLLNDGSFGVHNPPYARQLLSAAQYFIIVELNK
jgi:hypothetical protein